MSHVLLRSVLLMLGLLSGAFGEAQLFDPAGPRQSEHDASRLDRARARSDINEAQQRAAQARLDNRRRRLGELEAQYRQLTARLHDLDRTRLRMGEDAAQVYALARSSVVDQGSRLRTGALAAQRADLSRDVEQLTTAAPGIDTLHRIWYALHAELAAAAEVVPFDAPVTFRDGVRVRTRVTRFGNQLLTAQGIRVEPGGTTGLLESPLPLPRSVSNATVPAGSWRLARSATSVDLEPSFASRRVFEGGWIGYLILLCALGGASLVLFQCLRLLVWGRLLRSVANAPARLQQALTRQRAHLVAGDRNAGSPRDQVGERRIVSARDRYLRVVASAAMLLGLLGTVVGLIQTFRSLAIYGGTEASLAAAGIAHALATTWMGLSVAIPLLIAQVALTAWRRRVENRVALHVLHAGVGAARAPSPAPRLRPLAVTRWRDRIKDPASLAAAAVLTFGLFLLMEWLIERAPAEPQAPEPVATVARIDWKDRPPPVPATAPADRTRSQTRNSYAAAALPALPALPAPDLPATAFALPATGVGDRLAGMLDGGGGALAGVDDEWPAAHGGEGFTGSDLIPISSARPKYPRAAAAAGLEGWVELLFIIEANGRVANIRVIDAEPRGVFENAAATAMSKWLYAPYYRDGQPVTREATQLFRFKASDIQDLHLYDGR